MLEEGDKAPDFTMSTDSDGEVSLADFKGHKLVLYFYPKDDTPGCTKQAIGFSEMIDDFEAAGARVLGVSKDTVTKHGKFRDKHDLRVGLASDEEGAVIEAYGSWVEKSMYGKTYMGIDRSTFLIDGKGVVQKIWRKVRVPKHVEQVLAAVQEL
ncbi:MAG: thioredoxin-dependent thiol peroxidase [Pseudomonadota bacterium]